MTPGKEKAVTVRGYLHTRDQQHSERWGGSSLGKRANTSGSALAFESSFEAARALFSAKVGGFETAVLSVLSKKPRQSAEKKGNTCSFRGEYMAPPRNMCAKDRHRVVNTATDARCHR